MSLRYQLIWVLFWATVGGWAMQNLASRLGVVTGKHLAEVCRYEYPKPVALALWILTEFAIIGSDIQEVFIIVEISQTIEISNVKMNFKSETTK